ncbi:MAG: type II CRISPR-associated endonuclease Cas1 [Bacteroidales bacterium]|nr:type II CRISPR-associated endonuclease Cas1 [Bacteroidales bacterium]
MIKRTLCFSNPVYLSLKDRQMLIRLPEVEKNESLSASFKEGAMTTVPVEDIGVVLLDNRQITVTQGLLDALLENNCAVITCDTRHLPTGLMLPLEGNSLQRERYTDQLQASLPLRKQLWQQTVQAKIRNQAALLKKFRSAEIGNMLAWADKVKSDDGDNLEARAAAYYWRNMFPDMDEFVREREGDYPNNLLNYGYAILRAIIARALVSSGLLPTWGIHHHNRYNAYCLADDIMEPYRPYVDKLVIETMGKYPLETELSGVVKRELLTIPVLDVFMDGLRRPLMVAASQTTSSLYKCFSGELRKIIYPEIE